jgi:phenylacetate-CoA ligase
MLQDGNNAPPFRPGRSQAGMRPMTEAIGKFLDTLRRTQFMPAAQMQDYQRGLLERLLRHAREQVPFYRDSDRLGPVFARDGTIDWSRFGEIPKLTRREVQQNFEALKAQSLGPEHGAVHPATTSGTTGEPVTVLHSDLSARIAWTAVTLRDFEMHGIDATRHIAYLYPFTAEEFESGQAGTHEEWYSGFAALGLGGRRTDISDMQPSHALIEAVSGLKPDYLRVQPVALELMCSHDRAGVLTRAGLSGILSVGEYFDGDAKADIAHQLGCNIVEVYGSSECGRMATTCALCGGYHAHAETVHMEIVKDNGSPAAPGESGTVLATPLYNYAMPLIRYDHADEARAGEQGICTIQLPVLDAIFGKRRTAFTFPDGTTIRPTLSSRPVVEWLGAEAFQFVQTAPDRCEIRFVPGSLRRDEMRFDDMTAHLRAIWWHGLNVDYRVLDQLPGHGSRAKPVRALSECPPDRDR